MKRDMLDILRCPGCRDRLLLEADREAGESVEEGRLVCRGCSAEYAIRKGIPRFVETDDYVDNFSFEWTRHRETQIDQTEDGPSATAMRKKLGLRPADFSEKLVLDAGVGAGRYAEVASRSGATVVGLDLSFSVDAARENLASRENVELVQGDLLSPPFAPDSFDAAYSIGVLHHTPDAAEAFAQTAALVQPGGFFGVWVYSGHNRWYRFTDLYRKVTTRLPKRLLHALCYLAVPIYYLYKIPLLGRIFEQVLHVSDHPNWRWRVLDTFDWYSPEYQSKHTFPEVASWFQAAGFGALRLYEDPPVGVTGTKHQEAEVGRHVSEANLVASSDPA